MKKLTKGLLFGLFGLTTVAITTPVVVSCSSNDNSFTSTQGKPHIPPEKIVQLKMHDRQGTPVKCYYDKTDVHEFELDKLVTIDGTSGLILSFTGEGDHKVSNELLNIIKENLLINFINVIPIGNNEQPANIGEKIEFNRIGEDAYEHIDAAFGEIADNKNVSNGYLASSINVKIEFKKESFMIGRIQYNLPKSSALLSIPLQQGE